MSIHIDVYRDASIFLTLESEWNVLVDRSETSTPFQRLEFQSVWWTHFADGELLAMTARDDNGLLVGLSTWYIGSDRVLRWVGGEEIADYLDVIASAKYMNAVRESMFHCLMGPEADSWTRMQLSNIPEWSETPGHWSALAESLGWAADVSNQDVCPEVRLPSSFDDYLSQLGGKQRREINRKMRRVSARDGRWYIVDEPSLMEDAAHDFMELMATSSVEKAAFLTPKMRAALCEIFQRSNASGLFGLCFFEVEGQKVAACAYFTLKGTLYLYNSGYDLAIYGGLSPGWVLLAHLIEHAIETGHTKFDFMRGDEDYKYKFGGHNVRVLRLTIDKS